MNKSVEIRREWKICVSEDHQIRKDILDFYISMEFLAKARHDKTVALFIKIVNSESSAKHGP